MTRKQTTMVEALFDLDARAKNEVIITFYVVTEGIVLPPVVPMKSNNTATREDEPIKPVIRPNYASFFNTSYFSDVQLECQGKLISAHRVCVGTFELTCRSSCAAVPIILEACSRAVGTKEAKNRKRYPSQKSLTMFCMT